MNNYDSSKKANPGYGHQVAAEKPASVQATPAQKPASAPAAQPVKHVEPAKHEAPAVLHPDTNVGTNGQTQNGAPPPVTTGTSHTGTATRPGTDAAGYSSNPTPKS